MTKPLRIFKIIFSTYLAVGVLLFSGVSFARNIYVNGVDINGAVDQTLNNVTVYIDKNGDILISAPQYRVIPRETAAPLAPKSQRLGIPMHKSPRPLKLQDEAGGSSEDRGKSKANMSNSAPSQDKDNVDGAITPAKLGESLAP